MNYFASNKNVISSGYGLERKYLVYFGEAQHSYSGTESILS